MTQIHNTLIELCKYYMEFIESDFKSNRLPSRKVSSRSDGLKNYVNFRKYPALNEFFLKYLHENLYGSNTKDITVGEKDYYIKLNEETIRLIEDKLKSKSNTLFSDGLYDEISIILDKEKNLTETQKSNILSKIKETNNNTEIRKYLQGYIVSDLFDEVFELYKNKQLLEREELYLYFYEITYKGNCYPVFYNQILIEKDEDKFKIQTGPVFFINKKALQFVADSYSKEEQKVPGMLELDQRQYFLGDFNKTQFQQLIQDIVEEIRNYFNLKGAANNKLRNFDLKSENNKVALSNTCFMALFDKTDESTLNDYEEMLTMLQTDDNNEAFNILRKISDDILFKNPQSYETKIDTDFSNKPVSEKMSFQTPIPLNEEQQQILQAIEEKDCDKIVVHGPPGTGKSHTITSIIYHALLKNKTVLVTSDKKEALDVVEDKIEEALQEVNIDEHLQNPLLRLGKRDNNYNKIFNRSNFERIKKRYYTLKDYKDTNEKEIKSITDKIENDIEEKIKYESSKSPDTIKFLLEFEEYFNSRWKNLFDEEEIANNQGALMELYDLLLNTSEVKNKLIKLSIECSNDSLSLVNSNLDNLVKALGDIKSKLEGQGKELIFLKDVNESRLNILEEALNNFEKLRKPIVGYLFSSKQVKQIEDHLEKNFVNCDSFNLKKDYTKINQEVKLYRKINELKGQVSEIKFDPFVFKEVENINIIISQAEKLDAIEKQFDALSKKLGNTVKKIGVDKNNIDSFVRNTLLQTNKKEIEKIQKYLESIMFYRKSEEESKAEDFKKDRKHLQKKLVTKMMHILDESIIQFRENNKNDAEQLRKIIKNRQQISEDLLNKLTKAFPCLLVNIRDLSDYIPLATELFDVVIIDEASQVSIAQSFPAIIRGKKFVVLGDEKQYSNVKSYFASKQTNNFLFNKVEKQFKNDMSELDTGKQKTYLGRIKNFDVKNSILNFTKNISNYDCLLRKHFRGYHELISFSNKEFYDDTLEVMKIRGKPVEEVISFNQVEPIEKEEIYRNTNQNEAEFIVSKIMSLRNSNFHGTIGVITPFKNQQKLIHNMLYNSGVWEELSNKFNLKVMTFDTCQGDEKDQVFYSMVEKPEQDRLKYIFPVELEKKDLEEEGDLKAQRLNVGFSRVKEKANFVISKDVNEFFGASGNAIQHFYDHLNAQDHFEILENVDPNSPMEREIINYIVQTNFYKKNRHKIEIEPQFDLGKYIKQLHPNVEIPNYRVDFLLIYNDGENAHYVIIEYDGFEYHFKEEDRDVIDELNFDKHYIEKDIERKKTIELYGYDIISLNKFNLGRDPIKNINNKIESIIKKKTVDNQLENLKEKYNNINIGKEKYCPRCEIVKPIEDFYDEKTKSGYGLICNVCKKSNFKDASKKKKIETKSDKNKTTNKQKQEEKKCTQCNTYKPLSKFKRKGTSTGYGRICKDCYYKCPKCGGSFKKRRNYFGVYLGCSSCSSTRKFEY